MDTPQHIQRFLDERMAEDFAAYIGRRNKRHPHSKATLSHVCRRFRLRQAEAIRVIENVPYLTLSEFAYKPDEGGDWPAKFMSSFYPSLWPNAPCGKRLVMILE